MLKPFKIESTFVPAGLDAADWGQLAPLYASLINRPVSTPRELESLILDRSELDAAVSEAGTEIEIAMTCHTDDQAANAAYSRFVEQVQPRLMEAGFELDRKIVEHPAAVQLDSQRYGILLRDLRLSVDLYRPENVPLETELAKLAQEFQQIAGGLTVQFLGKERTLPEMAKFQEETDRSLREAAWRATAERRLAERDRFDDLFERMVGVRSRVAANAGYDNYRDYAHRSKRRFDYSPSDCNEFAVAVERIVVPALRRLSGQRAAALGVSSLRPWDLAVDPLGRPPLRPFATAEDMVERTHRAFGRMDAELGELFGALRTPPQGTRCLDLASRKGKAPGGYQASRNRSRVPFIFMNATGVQRDVETMVHEAGHAFHALLSRDEPLLAYRAEIPLEFCEVASMSMELTCHGYLDEFYGSTEASRARRSHLEGIAGILPWIATIDQFQQWVYTHAGHSRQQRAECWRGLLDRFGGGADWSGLEEFRDSLWHRQLHIFTSPFYYIEYGIAQLGALQLWARYRSDPKSAIEAYKRALSLGGSRPLPDLFAQAGLRFDFSSGTVGSAWKGVEDELACLPV